jgi:hypothetical protein
MLAALPMAVTQPLVFKILAQLEARASIAERMITEIRTLPEISPRVSNLCSTCGLVFVPATNVQTSFEAPSNGSVNQPPRHRLRGPCHKPAGRAHFGHLIQGSYEYVIDSRWGRMGTERYTYWSCCDEPGSNLVCNGHLHTSKK